MNDLERKVRLLKGTLDVIDQQVDHYTKGWISLKQLELAVRHFSKRLVRHYVAEGYDFKVKRNFPFFGDIRHIDLQYILYPDVGYYLSKKLAKGEITFPYTLAQRVDDLKYAVLYRKYINRDTD